MVYTIAKAILIPVYNMWLRKVTGLENAPKDKPFIIAANHSSYYETLLPYTILLPKLNKQIHALVNSRYWNNSIIKIILDLGKCIPVFIGKDYDEKKNMEAIEKAAAYLKKKELIQIFPEGTRSYDGKLQRAHNGIAKLALKSKVPVLPFGIINSHKVLPKGKVFPRFRRCDVKIGKPMRFPQYYNKKINKNILDKLTRSIMMEIAKLINQEYNY